MFDGPRAVLPVPPGDDFAVQLLFGSHGVRCGLPALGHHAAIAGRAGPCTPQRPAGGRGRGRAEGLRPPPRLRSALLRGPGATRARPAAAPKLREPNARAAAPRSPPPLLKPPPGAAGSARGWERRGGGGRKGGSLSAGRAHAALWKAGKVRAVIFVCLFIYFPGGKSSARCCPERAGEAAEGGGWNSGAVVLCGSRARCRWVNCGNTEL